MDCPWRSPMASITIRQLDNDLKQQLRLRAARNGRSMEDEVRTILRGAAAGAGEAAGAAKRGRAAPSGRATAEQPAGQDDDSEADAKRILLIVGGGIAAYKLADLIGP